MEVDCGRHQLYPSVDENKNSLYAKQAGKLEKCERSSYQNYHGCHKLRKQCHQNTNSNAFFSFSTTCAQVRFFLLSTSYPA